MKRVEALKLRRMVLALKKKISIGLMAVLLLTACLGNKREPANRHCKNQRYMQIGSSLRRGMVRWVATYSLLFLLYHLLLFAAKAHLIPGWVYPVLHLTVASLGVIFPVFQSSPSMVYITVLGMVASLCMLAVASTKLGLEGWKLFRLVMLPHPAIASIYGAGKAVMGATDTPWWGWIVTGTVAYLLLLAASVTILKLEGEL
ncbi:hypothetical protein [Candidatus Pyrohabitans sp.]